MAPSAMAAQPRGSHRERERQVRLSEGERTPDVQRSGYFSRGNHEDWVVEPRLLGLPNGEVNRHGGARHGGPRPREIGGIPAGFSVPKRSLIVPALNGSFSIDYYNRY